MTSKSKNKAATAAPRVRRWSDRQKLEKHVQGPTMTQQHMRDECDINKIMAKYEKTGLITHLAKYKGNYSDFTVLPDFQTAMNSIKNAEQMFLELPASVRERFHNDPGEFVEFATDECNLDEMREMGLAPKKSGVIPDTPPGHNGPPPEKNEPAETPDS